MNAIDLHRLEEAWHAAAPIIEVRNEEQYERALVLMDQLLELVGDHEDHPMVGLLDTLAILVHAYEEEHYPIPPALGRDVLRYLMEEHGLKQSDLPEVGSQGIVSEILSGKRELNARQMRALAARFNTSAEIFLA